MKVGFTPREAYNIYRSLAKETFNYFSYDKPRPAYRARALPVGHGEIAYTDFAVPGVPYKIGDASLLMMNAIYLPLMWEDELIGTFLHELGHVVAGFYAAHGEEWSSKTAEVGGHAHPVMLIRNWKKLPPEWHPGINILSMKNFTPDYA